MTSLNMNNNQNLNADELIIKRKVTLDLRETDLEESLMKVTQLEKQLTDKKNKLDSKLFTIEELEDKVAQLTEQCNKEHNNFIVLQKAYSSNLAENDSESVKTLKQLLDDKNKELKTLSLQYESDLTKLCNEQDNKIKIKQLSEQLNTLQKLCTDKDNTIKQLTENSSTISSTNELTSRITEKKIIMAKEQLISSLMVKITENQTSLETNQLLIDAYKKTISDLEIQIASLTQQLDNFDMYGEIARLKEINTKLISSNKMMNSQMSMALVRPKK
jgi:chromosome segregation ATPase